MRFAIFEVSAVPFRQMLSNLSRILKYLKPYWKTVACALLLTIIATSTRLLQARFVGVMMKFMSEDISSLKEGHIAFERLNFICGLFLAIMAFMGIATFLQKYMTAKCGYLAIRDFRGDVFRSLQHLPMSFFDGMRSGEIISRSTNDIIAATDLYATLADSLKNILIVVTCLGVMFYRDWQMTLVVLVLSPTVAIAISKFGKRIGQKTAKLQARLADLSAIQYENVTDIKVVKANTREELEAERFNAANEQNFSAQMKVVQVASTQSPVVEYIGIIGITVIVWFGVTRIMQGMVSFADMTEYWALMVMTTQPISSIGTFYGTCNNAAIAGSRAFAIIDTPAETTPKDIAITMPKLTGKIEFEHVSFSYDDSKEIFNDLSFTVNPGEAVAIVGSNGAGKSTLINLIPRFYAPSSGRILLDGIDISRAELYSLRSQIGVVLQELLLFQGTVEENIRCGNAEASFAEVEKAAQLANAEEFIKQLPGGYEAQIGERGSFLSGGQRQRLTIARSLLKDPRILLLDEYTSGLDAESENAITDSLDKAMENRTCLIIAHRLNTIRHANRILVLDKGRIAEEGTHEELLTKGGIYKSIYEAQLSRESQRHTPDC
ncbi:ABC transporter ATP-binding protein [bacterium]|nr:ABC transporter ATP-binding protein [bacterium]